MSEELSDLERKLTELTSVCSRQADLIKALRRDVKCLERDVQRLEGDRERIRISGR